MQRKPIAGASEALFDRVEPVLSYARRSGDPAALDAVCAFLRLYADADCTLYKPAEYLEQHAQEFTDDRHFFHAEPVTDEHVGDPQLMLACLRLLLDAIELDDDACLHIEAFEEEERREMIPRIGIGFDGPGRVPEEVAIGAYFRISLDEFGERWTHATQGGRVDRTENGLLLRLMGMRMPPEPIPEATRLRELLGARETGNRGLDILPRRRCGRSPDRATLTTEGLQGRDCRSEHAPTGIPIEEELDAALAYIDGAPAFEPTDLRALVRDIVDTRESELAAHSITLDVVLEEGMPPMAVYRERIRRFFERLLDYAVWVRPPVNSLSVLVEYEAEARQAGVMATLSANRPAIAETFHAASLARAIEAHHGDFDLSIEGNDATVTATLPDTVGRTLDEWLPGWPRFSARSQQMLRLLKSGGEVPREAVRLGGALGEQ